MNLLLLDGEKVRHLRVEFLRMTQKELAKEAGIGERTLQDIEANRREVRFATARLLSAVLDRDLELLISNGEPVIERKIPIQTAETLIRVVWDSVGSDCTVEEAVSEFKKLVENLPSVGSEISMRSGTVGSFHALLKMPKHAALLLQLFGDRNDKGEIVITDKLLKKISWVLSCPGGIVKSELKNVSAPDGVATVVEGPDDVKLIGKGHVYLEEDGTITMLHSNAPKVKNNGDIIFSGFSSARINGPARVLLGENRFFELDSNEDFIDLDSAGRITGGFLHGLTVAAEPLRMAQIIDEM